MQQAVQNLRDVMEEKFAAIGTQFAERDVRGERESRDNTKAVDAAFAAQKEAASEQNKSNTLAIVKSEKATAETLNKQADLFKSTTDALGAQITDLKGRLDRMEATQQGASGQIVDNRAHNANSGMWVGVAIAAISIVIAVISVVIVLIQDAPPPA